MREKIHSEITQLTLNDASYKGCGVSITPTLINFFYGNNGTGKSTIGKAIKNDSGVTWRIGRSVSDYDVHVYNQEYITANLQKYRNLPGVFSVNKVNIEIQRQVEGKQAERENASMALRKALEEQARMNDELTANLELFQQKCWNDTATLRREFEKTQDKRKTKKTFAEAVLSVTTPTEHDIDALARLYTVAYSNDAKKYREFAEITDVNILDDLQGRDILGERIVSSADTTFAQFIKAINATTWVQQGHEQYHAVSDGKCPYCQQKLPDNFEEDFRACFDSQYQAATKAISDFYDLYRNTANAVYVPLMKIPDELLPAIDVKAYNDKLSAVKGIISSNLQKIQEKKSDPAIIVELERAADKLRELSDIIVEYNKLIWENNAVIDSKSVKQVECKAAVWEHIAFVLSNQVSRYMTSKSALENEILVLTDTIAALHTTIYTLDREIADLNKNSVNTRETIASINTLLRDCGFQGFSLREKVGVPNVYEVVRPDGSIADNLSEGERNFIAFLYFYHSVKGSDNADGSQRDKIVVIDDPVSGMDDNSLFIVSSLVREMIEICENNAGGCIPNYIKQIFVLTHNAYFHREITYNKVQNYQYVNFYLISKTDNRSSVKCCIKPNSEYLAEEINYNPVQNSYAALWEEYKTITSPIPLFNVVRRIMEYYFLQMCGYDGAAFRKRILLDNKDKFITIDANGQEDNTKYQLANAMFSYISANFAGINGGIIIVDDYVDVEQIKEIFRLVFILMGQLQHYEMMMGNQ